MTTQWPWMSILKLRLIFEERFGPLVDHLRYTCKIPKILYHPFFKYFADHFQRNIWRRSFKKVPFYEKRLRETPRAPNVSSSTFSWEFRKGPSEAHIFTPQGLQKPFPEPFINAIDCFSPGGVLPCTGWLRPKKVPILGSRYMKG